MIITTHNSVFVNRGDVGTNIVVSQNEASPAKSVEQIRDTLGIRPSENLRHAELVLVVEGEDDRKALTALFSTFSPRLKEALVNGRLAIDPLNGSSNLSFKLQLLRDALCSAFVFVDYDNWWRLHLQRKPERLHGDMKTAITESVVELAALNWFKGIGFENHSGLAIAPGEQALNEMEAI